MNAPVTLICWLAAGKMAGGRKLVIDAIVIERFVSKYGVEGEVRRHSEKTPAAAPLSLTERLTEDEEENVELTLVTTDNGEEEHDVEEITNALASEATFTSPAPTRARESGVLTGGIMLGVTEVTLTMLKGPATKYGDKFVRRTQS